MTFDGRLATRANSRGRHPPAREPGPVPGSIIYPGCGWTFVWQHEPSSGWSEVALIISVDQELDIDDLRGSYCRAFAIVDGYAGHGEVVRIVYEDRVVKT